MSIYDTEGQDFSRRLLMLGGLQAGLFLVLLVAYNFCKWHVQMSMPHWQKPIVLIFLKYRHCAGVSPTAAANCWPVMTAICKSEWCRSRSPIWMRR